MGQYEIKSGDTFYSIAKSHGTTVEAIEHVNPGVSPSALNVGQKINLPGVSGDSTGRISTKYTIKSGDTFYAIAKTHGISVEDIQKANPGINPWALAVGEQINIPGGRSNGDSGNNSGNSGGNLGQGNAAEVGHGYAEYSGSASAYPSPSKWAPYDTLFSQNIRLMKYHASDPEIEDIRKAIDTVSHESGIDNRAILCTIMQESGGNPRVVSTNNGVNNPGLMQSHNGTTFNPANPAGSILQMVKDGTEGTKDGDGLKQLLKQYGNYYEAFRGYNSGVVNKNQLNDPMGATAGYVKDIANRLMGHVWNNM